MGSFLLSLNSANQASRNCLVAVDSDAESVEPESMRLAIAILPFGKMNPD
jgi:hypothetical protein